MEEFRCSCGARETAFLGTTKEKKTSQKATERFRQNAGRHGMDVMRTNSHAPTCRMQTAWPLGGDVVEGIKYHHRG